MKNLYLRMASVGFAAALTVLTACTDNQDTAMNEPMGQTEGQVETAQTGEEVIRKDIEPGNTDLGGQVVNRGETEAQAQKEIVTKRTETMSEDLPTVSKAQQRLDLNRMKVEDFVVLGLDRQQAEKIIQYREQNGPFRSFSDLSKVQGLDQNWLSRYRDRFAFVEEGQQDSMAGQTANE